ncbi:unnamed protein product [Rotaria socialis]|uniref:Uncharacterized protein n=1 Tax=Rotaria socialis TaxID=392032 RepID=A0A820MEQ5_9BILA|nr:unnamed protein product [Rotaria socialis]CAF3498454.1 unnamed protein product [Rotaria socialis]CAF4373741.1 unnamed protein product [Rotaria socialis]CAF4579831.1 unnamed protein product [Rotaria socialis]
MSTIRAHRVQSAYSRPLCRSATTIEPSSGKKRSTTAKNTLESQTNVLSVPAWRRLDQTFSPGSQCTRRRPKTSSVSTTTSSHVSGDSPPQTEIQRLLRCLDRDDKRIVHVHCLSHYRTLVETINLRETPVDQKLLCALQQRENRIVQRNACRDTRFHLLLNSLAPSHITGMEKNDLNDINLENTADLQSIDYPIG